MDMSGHHDMADDSGDQTMHDHSSMMHNQSSMKGMAGMMNMMHGHSTFKFHTTSKMLFKEWPLSTIAGLVLAMLATFVFAFLYEGLRYYVYVHSALEKRGKKCPRSAMKYKIASRISGTFLHMLHFFLGYLLMLASMTFNTWIFVSLILGATLGYFFIRPSVENYFRVIREMRDKCGTKGKLLQQNGCGTGETKSTNLQLYSEGMIKYTNTTGKQTNGNVIEAKECSNLLHEKISVL